jgi:hypothetical protein
MPAETPELLKAKNFYSAEDLANRFGLARVNKEGGIELAGR